jgi:subtilisin family serine protease
VDYAVKNGAKVVNMSFGLSWDELDEAGKKAIEELWTKITNAPGTLFVFAAHNFNIDMTLEKIYIEPAALKCPNCITVGALTETGELASISDIGEGIVDLYAPGVDIESAWPDDNGKATRKLSGTSMATPYVSGVASRIFEKCPTFNATQVRNEILSIAKSKKLNFVKNYALGAWLKKVSTSGLITNPVTLPLSSFIYTINGKTLEDADWKNYY